MARLTKRRAMLGFAALLPGLEVMLRDQAWRDLPLTEGAGDPLIVLVTRRMILNGARHARGILGGYGPHQNPPRASTSALNARSASRHDRIGRPRAFAMGSTSSTL
jgi:hypothetical protein